MRRDLVSRYVAINCRELKDFQGPHNSKGTQKGRNASFDNPLKVSPLVNALIRDDQAQLHFLDAGKGKAEIKVAFVALSWSDCHYGGQRPWFLCSGRAGNPCDRRVGKLYVIGGSLLCRHCGGLVYESQYHGAHGDALAKLDTARAIVQRLGGSGDLSAPFPPCPKGMHFKTYHRLTLAYFENLCTARNSLISIHLRTWFLVGSLGDLFDEDELTFNC